LPIRQFVPPPQSISRGGGGSNSAQALPEPPTVASGGNAASGVQAVIVGLTPAAGPLPQGSRPARFAVAPGAGPASSGSGGRPGAAVVPGLATRGIGGSAPDPAPSSSEAPALPKRYLLKEFVAPRVNRTLSAPLRPGSRVIPGTVEMRFTNRNVYTLVI